MKKNTKTAKQTLKNIRWENGRAFGLAGRQVAGFMFGLVLTLGALLGITGCGASPTGPDDNGSRTSLQIIVDGGGEQLHGRIDSDWMAVTGCWETEANPSKVRVSIRPADFLDRNGIGVFEYAGQYVYGVRIGNEVLVTEDLAALKHEFSHLVAEAKYGRPVENGDGRCWI